MITDDYGVFIFVYLLNYPQMEVNNCKHIHVWLNLSSYIYHRIQLPASSMKSGHLWVQRSQDLNLVNGGTVSTPLKFNMEPENQPLEKEIPALETIIFRFHAKLLGVYTIHRSCSLGYLSLSLWGTPCATGCITDAWRTHRGDHLSKERVWDIGLHLPRTRWALRSL